MLKECIVCVPSNSCMNEGCAQHVANCVEMDMRGGMADLSKFCADYEPLMLGVVGMPDAYAHLEQ